MNTDQNAALMNRLILLVLSLILVCLVLLVVRAYVKPGRAAGQAPPAAEVATVPEEPASAAEPAAPVPPRLTTRPTTNIVRAAPVAPRPTPPPVPSAPDVGDNGPLVVRDNSTLNLVGVGVSSSPGLGVGGGAVTGANDGEIYGIATLLGTPKPEVRIDLGPACGKLNRKPVTTRHYVVNSEGRLANVLVLIGEGAANQKLLPHAAPVLLDQVGCMFQPYTLALQTGQPLQVRNSDPELHNVHFTPQANREINIGQPVQGQVNTFTFTNPELFMRLKCDVHPWMFAYVHVVGNPWFAVTDTNGAFRLPRGLAAGRYTLLATHQKAGSLSQKIDFRPGEPMAIEFQFRVPDAAQAQNTGTVLVR